ncbi:hypothetical protein DFJ77DRAFT_438916 [Powellomyces hirtus]|nr:hypothetical protein DFJ77DRAFT_438916 [Powellomyces hirtus]
MSRVIQQCARISTKSYCQNRLPTFAEFAQKLAAATPRPVDTPVPQLPPSSLDSDGVYKTHFIPGKFGVIFQEEAMELQKQASSEEPTPRLMKPHAPDKRNVEDLSPVTKRQGRLAMQIQAALSEIVEAGDLHGKLKKENWEILHVEPSSSGKTCYIYFRNTSTSQMPRGDIDTLLKFYETPLRRLVAQRLRKSPAGWFPNLQFRRETYEDHRRQMETIMDTIQQELGDVGDGAKNGGKS